MFFNILKKTWVFVLLFVSTSFSTLKAQDNYASVNEIKLSTALAPEVAAIPAENNMLVSFPALLSGNEDKSLDYIENFSKKRRDYLIRTWTRGKRLFGKATSILKKYNIPQEFKVLLALESGFNANAVSKAGAVGYWQIMDETAKQYGLRIVPQPGKEEKIKAAKIKLSADTLAKIKKLEAKDERRNFNKSTYAAAKYLKDRCRNLNNDWLLVVASYNCGVGNVWNAMAASGLSKPGFWDIKDLLPAETQNYVMNFIAMNVIFNNYDKFAANKLLFRPVEQKTDSFEENFNDAAKELTKEVAAPSSLR